MHLQKKMRPWKRAMAWSEFNTSRISLKSGKVARIAGYLFLLIGSGNCLAEGNAATSDLSAYTGSVYRDAKAAFRRGEFEAAAGLFEKAELAGFSDPVIFYNLGAAYYKQGKYEEAEAAFATAASYEDLAPLSYFNLGLIAKRQDDHRNAYGWFRQAALHPEASSRLKRLSRDAIASLPKIKREKPALLAQHETRLSDFLRFSFNAGYGQDSNVFRAPKESYVDLAQPGTPVVQPLVQSGSFVPLDSDLEFRWTPYEHGYFSVRYDFDGKVYTKAEHKNANAFRNRFAIGGRTHIPKKNGYRYFRSHFVITRMDENYYDRTDGQDQFLGTTDISDRFKRTRFGPNVYYHRERGRIGYGFGAEAFINKYDNNFDEALAYLDLTHEQYKVGAHVSLDILKSTRMRLSYDRYRRDYTQRKAKSANGVRFTSNDNLQYDYHDGGVRITQDFGRNLDLSLVYRYTMRTDNFEGYDDYNRHSGMAELEFRTRRFSAETGIVYRTFDFPNGFAFDLPSAGEKTLDRMFAYAQASYRIRQRYSIMLTVEMDVVESTDPRSAYDKNQIAFGMQWSL
jgi:tetratricopeptide (TPR) repeat protein